MVTTDVPLPERPADGHLIIQMESCEINPGDKFFLGRATPPSLGRSVHNIWGVSGIGKVGKIGAGVPDRYRDQKVIVYRSLNTAAKPDRNLVRILATSLSELRHCSEIRDCRSVVAGEPDHTLRLSEVGLVRRAPGRAIATAGHSASGRALMGLGLQYEFPVISVVRSESAKNLLPSLGAKHVLVQELSEVENELLKTASELGATAVFEGLGGSFITRHATAFPERASLFCYGSSGGPDLISIPMRTLMSKELTVKSFSNFRSPTLQDPTSLDEAFRASVGSCICRYFNQEYTRNSNPRKSKKRSHSQVRDTEKR